MTRIITALILIPLVIWGLLALPPLYFLDVSLLVLILGAYEWTQFIPLKTYGGRFGFIFTTVIVGLALVFFSVPSIIILTIGLVGWIDAVYLVIQYQKQQLPTRVNNPYYRAWLGLVVLIPFWIALNTLRNSIYGPIWLLYGMSIVWIADSAAYFVGRAWGRRLLASAVSPKKTWEGVVGGVVAAVLGGVIWNFALHVPFPLWPVILIMVFFTAALSVLGDLFESLFKRLVNVKDSGVLLPGHGGLLDRIDALTLALPIFAWCSLVFLL